MECEVAILQPHIRPVLHFTMEVCVENNLSKYSVHFAELVSWQASTLRF